MSLTTLMRLTLLELWRQRIAFAPLAVLILLVFGGLLPNPEVAVDGEALQFAGSEVAGAVLKVLQFLGVVVGLVVGAGLVASEVERGTVLLLATKPVPRWLLVLGKAAGAFAFLLIAFALWGAALSAIIGVRIDAGAVGQTFLGSLLGVLPAWLFVAVSLAYSTRLPAMGAMAAGLFTWILAGVAPNLVGLKEMAAYRLIGQAAEVVTWILPGSQLDGLSSALTFGPAPAWEQMAAIAAIPAWLVLAMLLFQRRDLS